MDRGVGEGRHQAARIAQAAHPEDDPVHRLAAGRREFRLRLPRRETARDAVVDLGWHRHHLLLRARLPAAAGVPRRAAMPRPRHEGGDPRRGRPASARRKVPQCVFFQISQRLVSRRPCAPDRTRRHRHLRPFRRHPESRRRAHRHRRDLPPGGTVAGGAGIDRGRPAVAERRARDPVRAPARGPHPRRRPARAHQEADPRQHHAAPRAGEDPAGHRHPAHHLRQDHRARRARGDPRPAGEEHRRAGQSAGAGAVPRPRGVARMTTVMASPVRPRPATAPARAALEALGRCWELVLVDDGSDDGSAPLLDAIAAEDARVTVVHFRRNYGQTAAFMAGLDLARGAIVVPMDGDLQNDPDDIAKLLAKLDEGFDVVSGWRKDRQDHALKRNLPSRIANWLISRVSGVPLHDYGCSLKAYRRDVLDGVKLYGEMHRFVPIYAAWNGARVTELPVRHHPRLHGQSKYGLERVLKVVLDLLVVKFLFRYANKPMYVFGGFGVLSLLVGGVAGVWALALKLFAGTALIQTPLPLLAVFLCVIGIMSLLMGLLAEMLNRTYHESQGKPVYRISRIVRAGSGD